MRVGVGEWVGTRAHGGAWRLTRLTRLSLFLSHTYTAPHACTTHRTAARREGEEEEDNGEGYPTIVVDGEPQKVRYQPTFRYRPLCALSGLICDWAGLG